MSDVKTDTATLEKHHRTVITEDMLRAGQSPSGHWTATQLALLGVPWPPPAGWKQRILGRLVSEDAAKQFVWLRRT